MILRNWLRWSAYAYWLAMGGLMDQHGLENEPVPALDDKQLQIGGKG